MWCFCVIVKSSWILAIFLTVAGKLSADTATDRRITLRTLNNYVNKAVPEIGDFTDFMCDNSEALDIVVPIFLSLNQDNAKFGRLGVNLLMCRTSFIVPFLVLYLRPGTFLAARECHWNYRFYPNYDGVTFYDVHDITLEVMNGLPPPPSFQHPEVSDPSLTDENYTFWDFFKDEDDNGDAILRTWRAKMDISEGASPMVHWFRNHDTFYRDVSVACNQARPHLEPLYKKWKENRSKQSIN